MSKIIIEGGSPVSGVLTIQGAKNAALPILAATLLSGETCRIDNCPELRDVDAAVRILSYMGCQAHRDGGALEVDSSGFSRFDIPESLMRQMRSSVMFLGAILSRAGRAVINFPGGCQLGPRPIDLHISAMERLGATVTEKDGLLYVDAPKIKGAPIVLSFPSVGATENIMLAAARSTGTTTIVNAAQEPEIEDLQNFLNAMGAKISGAGGKTIIVEGVSELHGAHYRVMPDRIATATYLAAAAVTGGNICVEQACPVHLSAVLESFRESGCKVESGEDFISLRAARHILPVKLVRTMPYPAFPTDALAPLMAYLSLAKGDSLFIETIFQNRYRHVDELRRMGARIQVEGNLALVSGTSRLHGAQVETTDLRGGAALVVAALAANGRTEISEADVIARGYEKFAENLCYLGADALWLPD